MLPYVVQNHANGSFAHFGGIFVRCLAHDAPSYSGVRASGKPGAIQSHIYKVVSVLIKKQGEVLHHLR